LGVPSILCKGLAVEERFHPAVKVLQFFKQSRGRRKQASSARDTPATERETSSAGSECGVEGVATGVQ